MRKKLVNMRKILIVKYNDAMDDLASINTIDENCKGYVFIKRQYDNSRTQIIAAMVTAMTTNSLKQTIACIDVVDRFRASWSYTYSFYQEANQKVSE